MFSNFFPKIVPFMRKCRKIWWRPRGRRWQYGGALHARLVRLHMRKHTPAPMHLHPQIHESARKHSRAQARTHTRTHSTNAFVNAPQCYVIRTLLLLFMPTFRMNYLWHNFKFIVYVLIKGCSNMTGTNCDLFTYKSVPVIFEPPCT